MTKNVAQHQGTALHRIDLPTNDNPELPKAVFVAAQGAFLAFHLGNRPPLYKDCSIVCVSPHRQAPTQTDALMHMELFLAPMLQLGMSKGQMGSQDPMSQALLEKLRQGPDEPFLMDILTRHDAATVRATFPGALIQSVAEVMGQQITQQMRGGGEQKAALGRRKGALGRRRAVGVSPRSEAQVSCLPKAAHWQL